MSVVLFSHSFSASASREKRTSSSAQPQQPLYQSPRHQLHHGRSVTANELSRCQCQMLYLRLGRAQPTPRALVVDRDSPFRFLAKLLMLKVPPMKAPPGNLVLQRQLQQGVVQAPIDLPVWSSLHRLHQHLLFFLPELPDPQILLLALLQEKPTFRTTMPTVAITILTRQSLHFLADLWLTISCPVRPASTLIGVLVGADLTATCCPVR